MQKRNLVLNKAEIVKSSSFVVKYMGGHGFLKKYARKRDNFQSVPIRHYIHGKIDQHFLTWLIKEKYLILEDSDRTQIPYIIEKYRDYVAVLDELKDFMEMVKERV
jgi:hypothetical protein